MRNTRLVQRGLRMVVRVVTLDRAAARLFRFRLGSTHTAGATVATHRAASLVQDVRSLRVGFVMTRSLTTARAQTRAPFVWHLATLSTDQESDSPAKTATE